MAVKRFIAPDMRRALTMVRDELGPDAIILSSQRTDKGVEIITSIDGELPTPQQSARRDFGARFDQDVDTPLASDSAWKSQEGIANAAKHFKAEIKQPLKPRGEQLAEEIERARQKMLAAKRAEEKHNELKQQSLTAFGSDTQSQMQKKEPTQTSNIHGLERAVARPKSRDFSFGEQPDNSAFNASYVSEPAPITEQPKLDLQMAGLAEQVRQKAEQELMQRQQEPADDARLNALKNEIADMRLLLEQQMWRAREGDANSQTRPVSVAAEALTRHLSQLGLAPELVKNLSRCAKPGKHLSVAWREALALFARQLHTDASDPIDKGGVFALVGPTGVGKTTTIAKLASRYVLDHGLGKVALITTDTYRVGAHDQLRALGRILNVPVKVVEKGQALASVVASLRNFPLVLIDTAGFRHGDPLLREQQALLSECPGVKTLLALSCNSQAQTMKASAHAYGAQQVAGCILTKVDECASLGEALSVVAQQQIPLMYCTDGQGIPQDIAPASASDLIAKAVALMKASNQNQNSMAVSP